jgi:hypothetical protein
MYLKLSLSFEGSSVPPTISASPFRQTMLQPSPCGVKPKIPPDGKPLLSSLGTVSTIKIESADYPYGSVDRTRSPYVRSESAFDPRAAC